MYLVKFCKSGGKMNETRYKEWNILKSRSIVLGKQMI
jgi:hypothetical protein